MVCLNPLRLLQRPMCAALVPVALLVACSGCASGRINFNVLHVPETPILEISSPILGTLKLRIISFKFEKMADDKPETNADNN